MLMETETLNNGVSVPPCNRREIIEEILQSISRIQIIEEGLYRDARPSENRHTAQNIVCPSDKPVPVTKHRILPVSYPWSALMIAKAYRRCGFGPRVVPVLDSPCAREVENRHIMKMESIVASTKVAAECLGWQDRIGTLDVGKFADVVITRTDPLADIRSLEQTSNIALVMKGGEIVKDIRAA